MARDGRRTLQQRREQLLIRNAELRLQLAHEAEVLVAPLALADQLVGALRWLRQHPEWPLGMLAVWVVFKPRRALRWAARGWWGWRLARRLQRLWLSTRSFPLG